MIDFTLTDEQQMLVEMTHDFVEKEMLPHEETLERTDVLPTELAASLKKERSNWGCMPVIFQRMSEVADWMRCL